MAFAGQLDDLAFWVLTVMGVEDRGPELWERHSTPSWVVVWGWGESEGTFDLYRVVVVAWGIGYI